MYFTATDGLNRNNTNMKKWIAIVVIFGVAEAALFADNCTLMFSITNYLMGLL